MNLSKLREVLLDFQQSPLPKLTSRDGRLSKLPKKALSLIGPRRSGKTFRLYEEVESLLAQGVPKENILWINFEDDRLENPTAASMGNILQAYQELYPETPLRKVHAFFDEIQNVEGWERFIRRILDSEKMQVYLTGSSSRLLSREIATSLRGRTLSFEIFPFSFLETLQFHKIDPQDESSRGKARIKKAFRHYLRYGGFPEVLKLTGELHRKVLQEYLDLVIYKDMVERHQVHNTTLLKKLILHLLKNVAGNLSIHKVYKDFKSQGLKVAKDTLYQYLDYLSEAYSIFLVPLFTESLRKQAIHDQKIYPIDTGYVSACVNSLSQKRGSLLESFVFLQLRRAYPPSALKSQGIYYYLTRSGFEVDFVVSPRQRPEHLIQVCEEISEARTREREIRALSEAMEELELKQALLLTAEGEEIIQIKKRKIHVLPAWQWALGFK